MEFTAIKECVNAILHDLKDGSLKRIRPSTYKKRGEDTYSEDKSDIGSVYVNYYRMPTKD